MLEDFISQLYPGNRGGKKETKHFELKATDFTQKGMISISKAETKILVGWKKSCSGMWKSVVCSENTQNSQHRDSSCRAVFPLQTSPAQVSGLNKSTVISAKTSVKVSAPNWKNERSLLFQGRSVVKYQVFCCLKSNLQNVRQSLLDTPM